MRSVWNGAISFGLVSIPVKVFPGSEERRIDLDMLDKRDQQRIRYKRVNEKTGEEVAWEDIVKGFKKDESYVILEDEDFDQANMKKSKTIDIEEFVKEEEVAEVLYKKPYFLKPTKDGEKSYQVLRKALEKTGMLGVATFVMRQKEHLALIGVYEEVLVLYMIRFQEEVRDPKDLEVPKTKVAKKEVDMAVSLIEQYQADFNFSKYKDVYNDQLMQIIKNKESGKPHTSEKVDTTPTAASDLLEKLKASLERKKGKQAS